MSAPYCTELYITSLTCRLIWTCESKTCYSCGVCQRLYSCRSHTMTFPYHNAPNSSRDNFREPPTLVGHVTPKTAIHRKPQKAQQLSNLQRLVNVPNGFVLLWIALLWWGERLVFKQSIHRCDWSTWERWVCLFKSTRDILAFRVLAYKAHT